MFKSHGSADVYGYEWAIQRAFDAAKHDVLSRITTTIAALMPQTEAALVQVEVLANAATNIEPPQQKTA